MTLDIAAIKARADKATAGPWELSPHSIGKGGWISGEHGSYTDIVINAGTDRALTNADFIAHARTDIPDLLAALEASEAARVKAEQERDALKEALRQCISPICGYAIKDSAQALEVVSDFLEQIFRTSDIARKSLEASK